MSGPGIEMLGVEERDALLSVLETRELSRYRFGAEDEATPSKVYQFERDFETLTGARHCLGMNSWLKILLYISMIRFPAGS